MRLSILCLTSVMAACGSSPQTQPPGALPTPTSVTLASPGGDAHDPHWGALTRQLQEPWGRRNDKDDQLHAPLPDWEKWKRVRYWGLDHFTGFRYGDDHHAIAIAFVLDMPENSRITSGICVRRFEAWARPQVKGYDVQLEPFAEHQGTWRDQAITIRTVDGYVDTAFSRRHFSAAWAGYAVYSGACLVYAVAVPWRTQAALAKQLRDRWVREGFDKIHPLTEEAPTRKD